MDINLKVTAVHVEQTAHAQQASKSDHDVCTLSHVYLWISLYNRCGSCEQGCKCAAEGHSKTGTTYELCAKYSEYKITYGAMCVMHRQRLIQLP